MIMNIEPEIIKAIFATEFSDFARGQVWHDLAEAVISARTLIIVPQWPHILPHGPNGKDPARYSVLISINSVSHISSQSGNTSQL
jgi:hypothetical protein